MRTEIVVPGGKTGFAEDKDIARAIRIERLIPALERDDEVVLDFSQVKFTTQSFVHALIGEVLQRFREEALEKIEFRRCNKKVRGLIEIVLDYSLSGFN